MDARRLLRIAGWIVGLAAILWFFFGSVGPQEEPGFPVHASGDEADVSTDTQPADEPGSSFDGPMAISTPTPNATALIPAGGPPARRAVTYAIGLHDLAGLAPETAPGARLQLWAAWDPPLVDEPRVQRLVDEVVLEKIASPTLPEGPHVALLSLRPRDIPRLLYADQWGRLSVVMLDPQG